MASSNSYGLESNFDLMELRTASILARFDPMSPQDFVKYLAGPLSSEQRRMAYRYLFELTDDTDRVNAVVDFAEKSGLCDNLNEL